MVMWEPTGCIRLVQLLQPLFLVEVTALLLLSAKFSAQSEPNNFFDFFHLAVEDKNGRHDN